QVIRQRGAECHWFTTARVVKAQLPGVQRLTRELAQQRLEPLAGSRRQFEPPAIHRISHQREAPMRQVHPDLVGTPGFEPAAHMGMATETLYYTIMGQRRLVTGMHSLTLAILGVPADGGIDRPTRGHDSNADGIVFARYRARL